VQICRDLCPSDWQMDPPSRRTVVYWKHEHTRMRILIIKGSLCNNLAVCRSFSPCIPTLYFRQSMRSLPASPCVCPSYFLPFIRFGAMSQEHRPVALPGLLVCSTIVNNALRGRTAPVHAPVARMVWMTGHPWGNLALLVTLRGGSGNNCTR
jgi:hypothetical protein